MSANVATQPQLAALFLAANSRHDWAPVIEQNLIVAFKGFGHAIRQNYCNHGVSCGNRRFNICI
jgi:hypothetical protein